MTRILIFLAAVAVASLAAAWVAEHPGDVAVTWMGWRIETSVLVLFAALVAATAVLIFLWTLVRFALRSPRLALHALRRRRRRKGQRAVSRGLIALASGDLRAAQRFTGDAGRLAADEPLTLLLQAQAAQVAGDRAGADAAFRAMTERDETRLLGLRGLFVEAERRGDHDAARRYAEEAARSAPALPWAGQAVFEFRCAVGDWAAALDALEINLRGGLIERPTYRRRRAVLLTARALDLERRDAAAARTLALQAAKLAPDLVPATVLAAHLGAEAGDARRAGKMLEAAWRLAPHPEIANLYAHLRTGESARDRLARVRQLVRIRPDHRESALALARAALDAREFAEARNALAPLLERPTQRVATLMAELEDLEHADAGRAREWMGRALRAERDPAWTADGIVSNRWLPVSPVTGRLDAFAWKVPVAEIGQAGATVEPEAAPAALPSGESGAEDTEAEEDHPEAVGEEAAKPEAAPVTSPAPPPAPSTAPAPSTPPPVRSVPRRAAAVIPLMRAPDDPGIDGGPDEPAVRAAGSPPRGPLD